MEDVRRAVDQMPSIGKNLQGPIIIFYTHFSCFYEAQSFWLPGELDGWMYQSTRQIQSLDCCIRTILAW
jgi:hypothetical protein